MKLKKHIIINASLLTEKHLAGIGVYSHALVHALEKHFQNRDDVVLHLYADYTLYPNIAALEASRPSLLTRIVRKILRTFFAKHYHAYLQRKRAAFLARLSSLSLFT
ncbi:hypothetical protein [Helicobacter salomonis]|uniref:hypothetical protein n=1 Tax=Helicobacter salomonis TaxID=56878 RepID=UPI000CF0484D|nr:hypothetical protein [Helicobacter salomonis]